MHMDPYNTLALPYIGSSAQLQDLQNQDYYATQSYGPQHGYDSSKPFPVFAPPDTYGVAPAAGVASDAKRFSIDQFNDPFAPDLLMPFDAVPSELQIPPDASVEGNDKLLLFSMPIHHYTLADHSLNRTTLSLSAKLDGSFLASESILRASPGNEGPPPPVELTCYRRNLFQIEGTVMIPNTLRYIVTDEGNRIPIFAMELAVSATESVEGQPAKIISVPWKTPIPVSGGEQVDDKIEKEPTTFPLDIMSSQEPDSEYTTFPFSWRRLQFRNATANNGRRKELQQHYVLKLTIFATLSTGHKIALCDAISGPIIVRGRSPRNFQSRKDIPISGSAATSRRNASTYARGSVADAKSQGGERKSKSPMGRLSAASQSSPKPEDQVAASPAVSPFSSNASVDTPKTSSAAPATTPQGPDATPHAEKRRKTSKTSHAPIPLSLSEDIPLPKVPSPREERQNTDKNKRASSDTGGSSTTADRSPPVAPRPPTLKPQNLVTGTSIAPPDISNRAANQLMASPRANTTGHTSDIADALYEYFPLPPEDWQRPVDGVYRPHIVHHTATTSFHNWSRTYFAGAGEAA